MPRASAKQVRVAGVAAAALLALAALPASVPAGQSGTRLNCQYVEAGVPGPAENILIVKPRGPLQRVSVRQSESGRITVSGQRTGGANCSGPSAPSTTNVESVRIDAVESQSLNLELDVLGPGATPEVDGTGEIEVSVDEDAFADVVLQGSDDAESFAVRSREDLEVVDTNANLKGPFESDVELPRFSSIVVAAGGGADTIKIKDSLFAFVLGDQGNDTLLGGHAEDFLTGGQGADEIFGRGGDDLVAGDTGRDRMQAGPGKDFVLGFDNSGTDALSCGKGRDEYTADRGDSLLSCEREATSRNPR